MKSVIHVAAFAAAVSLFAPVALADDVTMEQLPDAVRQTVERETAQAQVGDIEQDEENGQTVYEVEFVENGSKFELDVAEDGQIVRRHAD
jgi:uncharacterized membrane protein YkoI